MVSVYYRTGNYLSTLPYAELLKLTPEGIMIDTHSILNQLIQDIREDCDYSEIAFKFHRSLVEIVCNIATKLKIKRIAFSGGVFQDMLLVDLLIQYLGNDFELYFHEELSPNDENISFGQLVH